ncbi:GGDEF domain-containing protein [Celeribacter baekdonensis]|uniref:GGDEF domain-containing protein n=1 Tax=Celeribacter baekdonensis TaxID=875171 RepID=UPI0030DDD6F9|tara:strand:+ start:130967 stop:132409 length:1443 start_codon:yes stop_codon:yes gene_type:complete
MLTPGIQPVAGRLRFGPAVIALRSQPYLALIAFFLALIIAGMELVRYGDDLLYAAGNGPNPLTLTCVMLLSVALMHKTLFPVQSIWRRVVFLIVLALSLFRLIEIYILQATPLTDVLAFVYNRYPHADVIMSKGTSLSLMLFSLGALIRRRMQTCGFVVSLLGLVPVSFAFMIYSYGERNIQIEMSPATLMLLMLVGFSSVFTFTRSPILRPFLTSSVWGRMARLQTLGTIIGIWVIGAVSHLSETAMMFEAVLASAMWVFAIIILVSGSVFERIERDRRTLSREVEHRARHDPLTGLLNRHAVGDYVAMIHQMAHGRRREDDPMTVGVILADIDLFKRVNDTLGHEAGDRVLQHVGRVLRGKLRSSDVVARWGGEEFLMLLPGATLEQTMNTAQVLRTAIATHVSWKNGLESEPITISIGVSAYCLHDSADSLEQIIQHADTALYHAKSQGRNRVNCFKTNRKPPPTPKDFLPPRDKVH